MTNIEKSNAMKQPDTAALRERLANYTPEDELEQDRQELEGLLQEINCQLIEFRNLLKEINNVNELPSMPWLRQRTVRTISWTASTVPLSRRNSTPSSMPKLAPMNWRKCINAQPNTSRPKKSCWRSTAIKWPNASKAMKAFGFPTVGSYLW